MLYPNRKAVFFFESNLLVEGFTLANNRVWHHCFSSTARSLCITVEKFDGFTRKNKKKYFNCMACNKEIEANFFKLYVYLNGDSNSKHSITVMGEREEF